MRNLALIYKGSRVYVLVKKWNFALINCSRKYREMFYPALYSHVFKVLQESFEW
jgi:hypothetical protein